MAQTRFSDTLLGGDKMRKRYLVDRNYQIRLILQIVILVVVATSVSAVATFMLANREVSTAFYLAHRDTWDLKELLLPVITGTSLVTFILVSAISAVIALRESHRIVGPVERLTGALNDLAQGRISFVGALRKDDVLKGLDEDINTLSENLARLDGRLREALDGLKKEIAGLRESEVLSGDQISRIRKCANDFDEALEFFRRN
jgi:methyl-accepting chemotaxis protein